MFGATIFNPGLTPYQSGVKLPEQTVQLAQSAGMNTIRITDYLNDFGNPSSDPYDEASWRRVDAVIAAAGQAGMHVDLGLADYRNMMWNNCIDPYDASWSHFIDFVANRVNTITGEVYKDDPTIAFVSIAGEPLPVGTQPAFTDVAGGSCTLSYSTSELTSFYSNTLSEWAATDGTVLANSGGLGYLNEPGNGIDWQSIMSLHDNAFCDMKTYLGMAQFATTVASYCASIGKPLIDEEFGWTQSNGDATRAEDFTSAFASLKAMGVTGLAFWNLGYEHAQTSYDVSSLEPLTWAAIIGGPWGS
jgi:hypothetical protein